MNKLAQSKSFASSVSATALVICCAFLLAAMIIEPAAAQNYAVIHNFSGGSDGSAPNAGIILDSGGRVYGTTAAGGNTGANCNYNGAENGCGAVYRLTAHGSVWITSPLYVFQGGQDGNSPWARVIAGPDGTLFGTTMFGGSGPCVNNQFGTGCGTIFRLQPPANACGSVSCPWHETVLYRFDGAGSGTHGANPMSEVVFDTAGNFYGTASVGGASGYGLVYKMTKTNGGWTYSVIYSFAGPPSDGAGPESGLIFDQAGNLYGTTASGPHGLGAIFELTPSGNSFTEKILYSLNQNGSDGSEPQGGLIFDPSGNLYGTTTQGGADMAGTAFELTPNGNSWTFSLLTNFPNNGCFSCIPGSAASLFRDSAGDLYGTSPNGGSSGFCGAVFKLTPAQSGYTYNSLYDFQCDANGSFPYGNVVPDGSGNLLGAAGGGGSSGHGVVFTISPN
jgi:hypothetical protein